MNRQLLNITVKTNAPIKTIQLKQYKKHANSIHLKNDMLNYVTA